MKKLKFSTICICAMLVGVGGAFATNTKTTANGTYYYANTGNVGSPANSDLKSVSMSSLSNCDNQSEQICGVESSTAPSGGVLPNGASYTAIDFGNYSN